MLVKYVTCKSLFVYHLIIAEEFFHLLLLSATRSSLQRLRQRPLLSNKSSQCFFQKQKTPTQFLISDSQYQSRVCWKTYRSEFTRNSASECQAWLSSFSKMQADLFWELGGRSPFKQKFRGYLFLLSLLWTSASFHMEMILRKLRS